MRPIAPRLAPSWAPLAALALAACDVDVPIAFVDGGAGSQDAGVEPGGSDAATLGPSELIQAESLREDFENRALIDPLLSEGVLIDTNRGVATLSAERFPTLSEGKIMNLASTSDFEGVVEGASVFVEPGVEVEALDALELRASDTLRISGRIHAGPGGVTLVAGRSIFIDGRIESLGPIRVRLAAEDGVIQVSGKLLTLPTRDGESAEVSLVGRGQVHVSGEVRTGDGASGSGAVLVSSYDDVEIAGASASVGSGAASLGKAGAVRLLSERRIRLTDEARITTGRTSSEGGPNYDAGVGGGDIELRAALGVHLGEGSRLSAGAAPEGEAGSIRVISGGSLSVSSAEILAGAGDVGGAVLLEAATATIGPEAALAGGSGRAAGGGLELSTAGTLALAFTTLRGGAAECGPAGSVRIHVGALLSLASAVSLLGGTGGRSSNRCIEGGTGGDVVILARAGQAAALTEVATPGYGAQSGSRSVTIDAAYERPLPEVRVRTRGVLVSRIIDRGPAAIGATPRLVTLEDLRPSQTVVRVELAGAAEAEGPFEPWHEATEGDHEALAALAQARFFRYRLVLQGRALDAPEVDAFEWDFAGR